MKKYINFSLVIVSGLVILYHRMIEELPIEVIILPLISFSLIMYLIYRRVHRQSHFYLLAILILIVYIITSQDFAEILKSNQFFSFIFFVITISFFIDGTVISFKLVRDRNIKKIINKLLYVYTLWIVIFSSPITDFLTIFISDFAGPIPEDITRAIHYFWLTSNIIFIIVVFIQVYIIYLTDKELNYLLNKSQDFEKTDNHFNSKKDILNY